MCIILDTNLYGNFMDPKNQDMQVVRDWINKKGRLAYSPIDKIEKELSRHTSMRTTMRLYKRIGKTKEIDRDLVEEKQKQCRGLKSDDLHIIALAQAGNIKLLVSKDKKLHNDFKNPKLIRGGSVYQTKKHKDLLEKEDCS